MSIAKKHRLRRIFNRDGKTLIDPMDHGATFGPIHGIEYTRPFTKVPTWRML